MEKLGLERQQQWSQFLPLLKKDAMELDLPNFEENVDRHVPETQKGVRSDGAAWREVWLVTTALLVP